MSSSTSRKYTESSGGKSLSIIKSNRLALHKLLFTSPGAGEYHFAHCGEEESRLSIGRGILTLKDKYEELLTWKEKQPLPINVAVSSAIHGLGGAFAGILVHSMFQACLGSQSASLLGGGPWVQARNFGAVLAVRSGLWNTMIHIPGIPDLVSCMAAGSGAGVTHSLLLGEPTSTVLATCLGFAALYGIVFKVAEASILTTTTDYTRSRTMLSKLGLEKFDKNGHLADSTLPLLTNKSPEEVGNPPEPTGGGRPGIPTTTTNDALSTAMIIAKLVAKRYRKYERLGLFDDDD